MQTAPLKLTDLKKMLIIDDENKLLLGLKAVMVREGFNVYTASNGFDGVELAKENLPDIIICDVMMPSPNGFQVKNTLTQDPRTASIPFIFLTARTGGADKVAGFNIGADDYVTKPFNIDELIARVRAILRRKQLSLIAVEKEVQEKIEQVRCNIASNLGHELRTPLGIILSSLDLAIRDKFCGRTEDLDWYLDASLASAQKLLMLVNDLILLNSIDQKKISRLRIPFSFKSQLQQVIAQTGERYAAKDIKLHTAIDANTTIAASEFEFVHAVAHLVDNAYKFSPLGGQIWVTFHTLGAGGCILLVENEGSFIPEELREKVFERYYQIDQGDSRRYGGLGVGLSIVRAVAEANAGGVDILDSHVGCKVRIILPPMDDIADIPVGSSLQKMPVYR